MAIQKWYECCVNLTKMAGWNATSPFFTTNIRCNWHGPHRRNLFCLERKLTRSCPKESYFWRSGCFNISRLSTFHEKINHFGLLIAASTVSSGSATAVVRTTRQSGRSFLFSVPGKTEFGRLARTSPGACLWKKIKSDCWIVGFTCGFCMGHPPPEMNVFSTRFQIYQRKVGRILVSKLWCLTKQHLESNRPSTAALLDSDFIWFLNLYSKVSQMGGYFWDTRVFSFWGWSLLMGLQCRKFNIAQNGDTFSKPSFFHPKFRVPKMEGFLNLMFGYFGWWGSLT